MVNLRSVVARSPLAALAVDPRIQSPIERDLTPLLKFAITPKLSVGGGRAQTGWIRWSNWTLTVPRGDRSLPSPGVAARSGPRQGVEAR